jgi:hypothetical protein
MEQKGMQTWELQWETTVDKIMTEKIFESKVNEKMN